MSEGVSSPFVWISRAIAASTMEELGSAPAGRKEITMIELLHAADHMERALPNREELEQALNRLLQAGYLVETANGFALEHDAFWDALRTGSMSGIQLKKQVPAASRPFAWTLGDEYDEVISRYHDWFAQELRAIKRRTAPQYTVGVDDWTWFADVNVGDEFRAAIRFDDISLRTGDDVQRSASNPLRVDQIDDGNSYDVSGARVLVAEDCWSIEIGFAAYADGPPPAIVTHTEQQLGGRLTLHIGPESRIPEPLRSFPYPRTWRLDGYAGDGLGLCSLVD